MHGWQKFGETSLQAKNEFHSNLNMEDFTNASYKQANEFGNFFETKNSSQTDLFESFGN